MSEYNLNDIESMAKLLDDVKENPALAELLNGKRIRNSDNRYVYFILDGKKCHICGEGVYNSIFTDWGDISEFSSESIKNIPSGVDLAEGCFVFRGDKEDKNASWYLLHDSKKCHIMSMDTVKYCHFKSPVKIVQSIVDALPNGININYK